MVVLSFYFSYLRLSHFAISSIKLIKPIAYLAIDNYNASSFITMELSRRSVARALPFCKGRDTRDGRLK